MWSATFCANTAQWLQLLTLGWLVKEFTEGSGNSALLIVGVVGVVSLPGIFVAPLGGVIGDRLNRRHVVMVLASVMSLSALSFAWVYELGYMTIWHVYAYAFLAGTCESIAMPVRQALISNTVPREYLSNAFTTVNLTFPMTRMVGPFVGGILASSVGFFWNLNLEAFLYMSLLILTTLMATPFTNPKAKDYMYSNFNVKVFFADLVDGFKYLFNQQRALFKVMILSLIPNVITFPLLFLLPVYTAEILKEGPDWGGYLLSVNGFGGMVSILVFSAFGFPDKRGLMCILSALVTGVLTLLFGLVNWIPLAFLLIVFFGTAVSIFRTTNGVLIQTLVDDRYRVRTHSFYRFIMSFVVISSFIIGRLIDMTSLQLVIVGMGILSIIMSVGYLIFASSVRNQP